jgi:hypothetical protein
MPTTRKPKPPADTPALTGLADARQVYAAAWRENHAPRKDMRPSEWCAEHVYLTNSPIAAKYQPMPVQDMVLDMLVDPDVYEIGLVAHTGAGKSVVFETALCYVIAQAPGPTLMLSQTDDTIRNWYESRGEPALKQCADVAKLIPRGRDRDKDRKDAIIFPHMPLYLGGANMTNVQEHSMRYVFGDEPWRWKPPILGNALKRHHDRWNRKALFAAQGGDESTAWHTFCEQGEGIDAGWACPECGSANKHDWDQMHYTKHLTPNDEPDWPAILPTIRYHCPACDHPFADTARDRQRVCAKMVPVPRGNEHLPGRRVVYYPAMANPRIEWASLVKEWITANMALGHGDKEPLREFRNKRLAQFWFEQPDVAPFDTEQERYFARDYADGTTKWDDETHRVMTVDVQKDHFWARIRLWAADGSSRGVYEGRVTSIDAVRHLQEKYRIRNRLVFFDASYKPDTAAKWAARFADGNEVWTLLKGDPAAAFPHYVTVSKGKTVKVWKSYSKAFLQTTADGTRYKFWKWSNLRIKDMLQALIDPEVDGPTFGVEADRSKHYDSHMRSEHKVLPKNSREWRWVPVREGIRNDLWDCECMQVVAAAFLGILSSDASDPDA